VLFVAALLLVGTMDLEIDTPEFAVAAAALGLGMGLVVSQLGNVLQSAVDESDRSEAGGVQNTAMQLGGSLGTALIGAVVISALGTAVLANVTSDPRISDAVDEQVTTAVGGGISFVSSDDVEAAAQEAGLSEDETTALIESYEDAQIRSLKLGLLVAANLALTAQLFAGGLPSRVEDPEPAAA
jgi:hypothetical protein